MYHFALKSSGNDEEEAKRGQEGRAKLRSGTSAVKEMPDKTAELNADEHVSKNKIVMSKSNIV